MFNPAWFLTSAHAQTVWGRIARPRRLVALRREALETPDGDELIVDHVDVPSRREGIRALLLHGLEGSSYSVYMQGIMSGLAARGIPSTAMNFRFCARDPRRLGRSIPNRRPRLYHSGETGDFDHLVKTMAAREPECGFVAFGASLGGNVLLKWLGENSGQRSVHAAATLSVPYDLAAGAESLDTAIGRIYVRQFVVSLVRKSEYLAGLFPELRRIVDYRRASRARTFREFDDAATAPMHGFESADDYWTRSSSIRFVPMIDVPTLCISAYDDPFLPSSVLDEVARVKPEQVELVTTTGGGHAGFVTGVLPWKCEYWAEEKIVRFLADHAG
jgi:uncharacterized protein